MNNCKSAWRAMKRRVQPDPQDCVGWLKLGYNLRNDC